MALTPSSDRRRQAGARAGEPHLLDDAPVRHYRLAPPHVGRCPAGRKAARFTSLLHLPGDRHGAEVVRDAVVAALAPLPAHLRRSLAWDQGSEMALHAEISAALAMPVFFCDKASPWQRPSNERTNGLLRQYFPKGADLRAYGPEQLAAVAAELNARPRKVLGWDAPAACLARLLPDPLAYRGV